MATLLSPSFEALENVEVCIGQYPLGHGPLLYACTCGHGRATAVLAGQKTAGQGKEGKVGKTEVGAGGQYFSLIGPLQQAVLILNTHKLGTRTSGYFGFAQLSGREVRTTNLDDFAFVDEFVQDAQRFGDWHRLIRTVELVEIDAIRSELAKTPLDRLAYVCGGGTTGDLLVDATTELGGQDDVVTATAECALAPLLTGQIRVSGVKEVDTDLERGIHHGQDSVFGHGEAKVIGSESNN